MAMKPIYAAGLDAGSRKTRMAICVLEQGRLRFLGASSVDSEGWLKGKIADQKAVSASISCRSSMRTAVTVASFRVTAASLTLGSNLLRPRSRGDRGGDRMRA